MNSVSNTIVSEGTVVSPVLTSHFDEYLGMFIDRH